VPELGVGFVSGNFLGALGTEFLERYRITFLPDMVGRKEGAILLEAREQYTPRLWDEVGKLSDGTVGSVAELTIRKANGVMRAVRVPQVSNLMTDASAAPFRLVLLG
jgi:hypothetical protein